MVAEGAIVDNVDASRGIEVGVGITVSRLPTSGPASVSNAAAG